MQQYVSCLTCFGSKTHSTALLCLFAARPFAAKCFLHSCFAQAHACHDCNITDVEQRPPWSAQATNGRPDRSATRSRRVTEAHAALKPPAPPWQAAIWASNLTTGGPLKNTQHSLRTAGGLHAKRSCHGVYGRVTSVDAGAQSAAQRLPSSAVKASHQVGRQRTRLCTVICGCSSA